jgi:ADP-heptose:LPS heptosyltransferase
MFKKYAVIHIDKRETPHRNTYGINWDKVRSYLEGMGYVVIQIGKNDHDVAGIELNTTTVAYMKFVIAGCDLFIGVDSGPASIAVAYNKPSVLLFGSVNPKYIHPDLTNVEIVQGDCDNAFCWHIQGGTSGQKCKYEKTEQYLQCCNHSYFDVIAAINKLNLNPNDQN